jgi:predicted Zn finger-like uncharacterized protein
MKTQCPYCQTIQQIPDTYKDRAVKCQSCQQLFTASQYSLLQTNPDPEALPSKSSPPESHAGTYLTGIGLLVIIFGGLAGVGQLIQGDDVTLLLIALVGGFILIGLSTIARLLDELKSRQ